MPASVVIVAPIRVTRLTAPPVKVVRTLQAPPTRVVSLAQQGRPGPKGDQGERGLPGAVAGSLPWSQVTDRPAAFTPTRYEHLQSIPSAVWTIQHNLGRLPSVTVIDSAGEQVWSTVQYPDANTVLVISGAPTTGRAELI